MTTMLAIGIWRKRAACSGQENLFQDNPKKAKKEICGSCPVRDQCLKYALIYSEFGIWGGTTKESRDQLIHEQPEIQEMLIQEARALGIYEVRVSAEQYQQQLRQAQQKYLKKEDLLVPTLIDWNDPDTWLDQVAI